MSEFFFVRAVDENLLGSFLINKNIQNVHFYSIVIFFLFKENTLKIFENLDICFVSPINNSKFHNG